MLRSALRVLAALAISVTTLPALAATSRSSVVVQEIYNFNHPLASQLPGELGTKMQKMAAGPFAFYRGTAHLFYKDMKTLPASAYSNTASSYTWIEGDMHLQNLGAFRDANGNFVFDTTDFDEGFFGPFVWDVRRMAVSILLAAKENGISSSDRQKLVQNFVDSYISALEGFMGNSSETTFRLTSSNTNGEVKDVIQSAENNTRSDLLSKYTIVSGSTRRFKTQSDLVTLSSSQYSAIAGSISGYVNSIASSKRQSSSYYTVKDIRLKTGSGTGSLGRYRYYVLIQGPGTSTSDDVILEMKQELTSAVNIAAPGRMPSSYYGNHQGQRVARSLKAMLNNADPLAGYTTANNLAFFLREKSPYEEDFDYTKLNSYSEFNDAVKYAAQVVAKNHAIADKDYDSSLLYSQDKEILSAITSKSGFRSEILSFANDYAQQVELDYNSFLNAYRSGQRLY